MQPCRQCLQHTRDDQPLNPSQKPSIQTTHTHTHTKQFYRTKPKHIQVQLCASEKQRLVTISLSFSTTLVETVVKGIRVCTSQPIFHLNLTPPLPPDDPYTAQPLPIYGPSLYQLYQPFAKILLSLLPYNSHCF
jgi:hypothetical protein